MPSKTCVASLASPWTWKSTATTKQSVASMTRNFHSCLHLGTTSPYPITKSWISYFMEPLNPGKSRWTAKDLIHRTNPFLKSLTSWRTSRLPKSILVSLILLQRRRVLPPTMARRLTTSPTANESQPISARNVGPTSITTLRNATLLPTRTRKATLPQKEEELPQQDLGLQGQ
jgi:hypothetical protein